MPIDKQEVYWNHIIDIHMSFLFTFKRRTHYNDKS